MTPPQYYPQNAHVQFDMGVFSFALTRVWTRLIALCGVVAAVARRSVVAERITRKRATELH